MNIIYYGDMCLDTEIILSHNHTTILYFEDATTVQIVFIRNSRLGLLLGIHSLTLQGERITSEVVHRMAILVT